MIAMLVFISAVMQLSAANGLENVPLRTLCETYSGEGATMGVDDFNELFNWYV
jgi:hypothetical protein